MPFENTGYTSSSEITNAFEQMNMVEDRLFNYDPHTDSFEHPLSDYYQGQTSDNMFSEAQRAALPQGDQPTHNLYSEAFISDDELRSYAFYDHELYNPGQSFDASASALDGMQSEPTRDVSRPQGFDVRDFYAGAGEPLSGQHDVSPRDLNLSPEQPFDAHTFSTQTDRGSTTNDLQGRNDGQFMDRQERIGGDSKKKSRDKATDYREYFNKHHLKNYGIEIQAAQTINRKKEEFRAPGKVLRGVDQITNDLREAGADVKDLSYLTKNPKKVDQKVKAFKKAQAEGYDYESDGE